MSDSFEENANAPESTVSVIKVAGRSYAVGLLWAEVGDKSQGAKEARQMAARPSVEADLFVMRSRGDQFGLGWRRNGHQKGMPSLAGHMADQRSGSQGSWLGIFEVEGGHYVIAVNDDVILSQTDQVYADEMVARARFEDLLNGEWTEIFVPEGMGYDVGSHVDAAAMVAGGKPPRLADVDKVSGIVKWGGAVLAVLVLLIGGFMYQNYVEENRLAEEAERLAQAAIGNKANGGGAPAVEVPAPPWTDRFVAGKFLNGCSEAMRAASLDFPGWKTMRIECDGKATGGPVMAKMSLDRSAPLGKGGGTINWVRATLDRSPGMTKASAMPGSGDNSVAVAWQGPEVERNKIALPAKAADIGKARFYMQSWFEESFTPVSFPTAESTQFYRMNKFKFETPYDPSKFSVILDRMPGVTVDKMAVDLSRSPVVYSVEGTINEDLPLPPGARIAGAGQPQASAAAVPSPRPPRNP